MIPSDLKAKIDASTPGPWHVDDGRDDDGECLDAPSIDDAKGFLAICDAMHGSREEDIRNAAAIVALRNAGPLLLELWEAAGPVAACTQPNFDETTLAVGKCGRCRGCRIDRALAALEALPC